MTCGEGARGPWGEQDLSAADVSFTVEELAEIEAVCKAATPGPWQVLSEPDLASAWLNAAAEGDDFAVALFDYRPLEENQANARFCAVAREGVPRLIAEVRQLRQRVQQLLEANSKEVDRRSQALRERDEALARLAKVENAAG